MPQSTIKNLELTIALDKGLNPANPVFIYNSKGLYFQRAEDRSNEEKHFSRDELDRLKEICKWEKLLLIPDNNR